MVVVVIRMGMISVMRKNCVLVCCSSVGGVWVRLCVVMVSFF